MEGEETIETFAQRRVEGGGGGGEGGNFQSRKQHERVRGVLCDRTKERDPQLRAQEAGSDLKASNSMADTKRAKGSHSSKIGGKSRLLMLLQKTSQRAKRALGVIEIGAHRVGGANNPAIGGAGEIKEKFDP